MKAEERHSNEGISNQQISLIPIEVPIEIVVEKREISVDIIPIQVPVEIFIEKPIGKQVKSEAKPLIDEEIFEVQKVQVWE